jgi:hypothetical protein
MVRSLTLRCLAVAALLILVAQVSSDDKNAKKAGPQKKGEAPSKDAMMEAMMKAATPGPEHKRLDDLAGSWTFTAKMWMEPGAAPTESKGTSETKWILGGRFLAEEVTGEFMGMPFHGYGLTGYDNVQKKYVSVWFDSFATGYSQAEGSVDASGKVLTLHREDLDPATNQKIKGRDVTRILGHDKHIVEMYKVMPDGKEFKMMEITVTRRASGQSGKAGTQK